MKRSDVLCGILLVMFVPLLIAAFAMPQETQINYELLLLGLMMPVMGSIWTKARVDAMRGN
jgi:hypothetical protein